VTIIIDYLLIYYNTVFIFYACLTPGTDNTKQQFNFKAIFQPTKLINQGHGFPTSNVVFVFSEFSLDER
jgi:hypothetical protein